MRVTTMLFMLAAGTNPAIFAADAVSAAQATGDPESLLLADSAQAAAKAIAEPTQCNTDNFVALAQQRASGRQPPFLQPRR